MKCRFLFVLSIFLATSASAQVNGPATPTGAKLYILAASVPIDGAPAIPPFSATLSASVCGKPTPASPDATQNPKEWWIADPANPVLWCGPFPFPATQLPNASGYHAAATYTATCVNTTVTPNVSTPCESLTRSPVKLPFALQGSTTAPSAPPDGLVK